MSEPIHTAATHSQAVRGAVLTAAAVALLLGADAALAQRATAAKFDDSKTVTIEGVVTGIDWRNPYVHVFVNVPEGEAEEPSWWDRLWGSTPPPPPVMNWAVEVESIVVLERSGWSIDTVRPGETLVVTGWPARNGTRQVWGDSVVLKGTGARVLYAKDTAPNPPLDPRPTPRWEDGKPRLGSTDAVEGYWGYPTSSVLFERGAQVAMRPDGRLENLADAAKVAPFQPWALALYKHRQERQLQDDPMWLNCKPPGGVRQYQSPLGVQLVEDRRTQRIFVLLGSGNRNFRIIYLDGREQTGNVRGDDDNPLYYGRSIGHWEGDTLVVETTSFNEDFWFTNGGLPHTDQLKLTERFSRPDYDTLRYEVTVEDPATYTRAWSSGWDLRWVGGEELPSFFCQDNRS